MNITRKKAILIFERARGLIENKDNWTTRAWARDSRGEACYYNSPSACQWCAEGAIGKSIQDVIENEGYFDHLKDYIFYEMTPEEICWPTINDDEGHEAVLKKFDECLNFLKSKDLTQEQKELSK